MTRVERLLLWTVGLPTLLVAAAAAWFYAAPWLVLRDIRAAVDARDSATLARYMDESSVRDSLKLTLSERLVSRATGINRDNPFASIAAGVASSFMGSMVDHLVTPAGLAILMQGRVPESTREAASDSTKGNGTQGTGTQGNGNQGNRTNAAAASGADEVESSTGYEDFDRFSAIYRDRRRPAQPVSLVLTRHHVFWWRLTSIRLPE